MNKKKPEFIIINNAVVCYDEYVKRTILLKNYLKNKTKEVFFDENFVLTENKNSSYDRAALTFYNQELDLEVTISIKRKGKEVFV
jgi:hypothetical protein